jgi:exodeoxyribonuclease-3
MKIISWNVNSIKARGDHVEKVLVEHKPDFLMLQELKGMEFPSERYEALGYTCFVKPQKAYNGVAILTKHADATLVCDVLAGDESDEQARFMDVELDGVHYINIYLPNGNPVDVDSEKYPYKLNWMKRLHDYAEALVLERIPFLIGGDFNVIPEDKDCHDPKAWEGDAAFRPETHDLYRSLQNIGLYDAYRIFEKGSEKYSFWDYQRGAWQNNNGIRIDHFLLSPGVVDRAQNCFIDTEPRGWERPSDHTPIVLELA